VNPIERTIRRVDRAQQRTRPAAFVFGVIKKYGDDNGGMLAASLAHSAFVSVFPLLLILTTVLGLVAANDPGLQERILNGAGQQIPLIGNQLTQHHKSLQESSVIGLIVGLAALLWGTTNLAQAGLFTMEQVWNLPGPARPGFVPRLLRSLLFLGVLGADVIATTLLSSLNVIGGHSWWFLVLANLLALAVNAGVYWVAFRVLTPGGIPGRALVPGAVTGGVAWSVLQFFGLRIVSHFVQSNSAYGAVFGTVLALVAWIYLAVQLTVYSAEINVVLARHLWPRSLLQPPLTEADQAGLALQALQNQRRAEQQVTVTFTDQPEEPPGERQDQPPSVPRTPDEIAPPGKPAGAE
jgi:YihY family inner membrane protein